MRTMFTAGEWNDDEDAAKVLQRDDGVLLLVLLCRCCFFVLLLVLFSLYFIVVGFMLTFFFNFHCVTLKLLFQIVSASPIIYLTSITSLFCFRKALKTLLFKQFIAERS